MSRGIQNRDFLSQNEHEKGCDCETYISPDPRPYPREWFEQKYVDKDLSTNLETCLKNGNIETDDIPEVWEFLGNWGYFKTPPLILFGILTQQVGWPSYAHCWVSYRNVIH